MHRVHLVIVAFVLCGGCSKGPAIEGRVNPPVKGVTVWASAYTDIKEEQSRAQVKTTSDNTGTYLLTGLLPERRYKLQAYDKNWGSRSIIVNTAETGTVISKEPIPICPKPPREGVWVYRDVSSPTAADLLELKRVSVTKTEGAYGRFGEKQAPSDFTASSFTLDPDDVRERATLLPDGLLVFYKSDVLAIVPVYLHPEDQVFKLGKAYRGQLKPTVIRIPAGWYCGTLEFYVNDHDWISGGSIRAHRGQIFKLSPKTGQGVFSAEQEDVKAVSISELPAQRYLLVTKWSDDYKRDPTDPAEGYLIMK